MKKYILLFSWLGLGVACSTKKDTFINRSYHNFTSYYNTLFHGKEALNDELKQQKKSHQDNFQEGYIEVFTQNELASRQVADVPDSFFENTENTQQQTNNLKKAEEKALKVIENKSMIFKGIQKNKEIFNAYILLAEARIYQGKLLPALDAINQIYATMPKDDRLPLAKIYEGFIHSRMGNYLRAEDIFANVEKSPKLKKEYQKTLSVYQAQNLIFSNRKEEALKYQDEAFTLNKKRETKSRIAYLRGQILLDLGKKSEARESFVAAYKYANDFEFEVKSQIQIAKTFTNGDDYEGAKKYLEDISKKGTYASRKNEFYYALGLVANQAGKKQEALEFFNKSIREKVSDQNIRGLSYFEIGKNYFQEEDYIKAGNYYDSALASIQHPATKEKIAEISQNIKNFSKNYYLIKKNDSILALTKMTDNERIAYFQKHIEELKEKEAKERIKQEQMEKEKKNLDFLSGFSNQKKTDFSQNFINQNAKGKFYFSNPEIIAKGNSEFRRIWGNRALEDNWRYSGKATAFVQEQGNFGTENLKNADARRFEVEYYTEQIPSDTDQILALKKDRDTASLGLGRMYDTYFDNTPRATKTLYDLVDNQPEDEVKLQALYSIFSMNYQKNPSSAERAKALILELFPHTPYAEFVRNPRNTQFVRSEEEVEKVYQNAYQLYTQEKFAEAQKVTEEALQKYPNDALVPKFELLKAFIMGKTVGKEVMILQLQQIALSYETTNEGIRAKQILDKLTSDLDNENNGVAEPQKVETKQDDEPVWDTVPPPSQNKGQKDSWEG